MSGDNVLEVILGVLNLLVGDEVLEVDESMTRVNNSHVLEADTLPSFGTTSKGILVLETVDAHGHGWHVLEAVDAHGHRWQVLEVNKTVT